MYAKYHFKYTHGVHLTNYCNEKITFTDDQHKNLYMNIICNKKRIVVNIKVRGLKKCALLQILKELALV